MKITSRIFQIAPRHPARPAGDGFSFVEVLAAIAIIGIVTFLAIPNLIQIKKDGEAKLAASRAEALNMALASYIQANGKSAPWTNTADGAYALLRPYLSFAPTARADYEPKGYSLVFPSAITNLNSSNKVRAREGTNGTNWVN